nr:MAG TPA: hypothetical protein [Bacteriophage sp.]
MLVAAFMLELYSMLSVTIISMVRNLIYSM